MSSLAKEAAKEIAEFLNGKEFFDEILSAEMKLIPEKNLSLVKELKAVVVPHSFKSSVNRSTRDREIVLDIGITRRASESELEKMLDITQSVGDLLEGKLFSAGVCIEIEYAPLYDVDAYIQAQAFISVLSARIRVL